MTQGRSSDLGYRSLDISDPFLEAKSPKYPRLNLCSNLKSRGKVRYFALLATPTSISIFSSEN